MDPTLVANLENGTQVVLDGLTAEQVEAATYEDALAMIVAAKQLPWEPTGRCCSSYKKDVWTRRI